MLSGVSEGAKSIAGTVKAVGRRLLQTIFPMLRKETKETLDGVQDLSRSLGEDAHELAEAIGALANAFRGLAEDAHYGGKIVTPAGSEWGLEVWQIKKGGEKE